MLIEKRNCDLEFYNWTIICCEGLKKDIPRHERPQAQYLRKLPEDVLRQNGGVNQNRGRHRIQETGELTQENSKGKQKKKGNLGKTM